MDAGINRRSKINQFTTFSFVRLDLDFKTNSARNNSNGRCAITVANRFDPSIPLLVN